jgi:DNA-binding NarL/FixJ family response regulator
MAHGHDRTPLSPRQTEFLKLIALGKSSQQIGRDLGITFKTVTSHRGAILSRLGLASVAELRQYAIRAKLIPN